MDPSTVHVRDLMSSPVVTLAPEDDIATAAVILALKHIRHLPVVEHGKLVGLVTHRDILAARPSSTVHLSARETVALEHRIAARTIMRIEVLTTRPDALAHDAAQKILDARIGCLPVLDGATLVGIITEADLVRLLIQLL